MSGVPPHARSVGVLACLVFLLVIIPGHAHGTEATSTVFYVSPTGNDANIGTSRSQPFRHIQRCADVMDAGDSCVIGSGTYRETVRPLRSGTAGAPITYAADTGATVRIDGTELVGGWARVTAADLAVLTTKDAHLANSPFAKAAAAGTVYRSRVVLDPGLPAGQLFLDDRMMVEAQFPDPGLDLLAPRIQLARAGSSLSQIADPALQRANGYWTGAKAYVQRTWKAHTGRVTGSKGNRVDITGHYGIFADGRWDLCTEVVPDTTRYYLWGKLSELSAPGEWFYDAGSRTMYLRAPNSDHPASHAVAVKQRTLGFDLEGVSHTKLTGLNLVGTTLRTGNSSEGVVLERLRVDYPSHFMELKPDPNLVTYDGCDTLSAGGTTSGVILRGRNNEIRDSTIRYSAGNGIVLIGESSRATNNVISDVNYLGSSGSAGINIVGQNHAVMHNTVSSTGRTGISIHSLIAGWVTKGVRIAYNDVSRYGRLSLDLGAIWACCRIDLAGTSIDHNWVHSSAPMPGVPPVWASGIYLDGGPHNALVHSNVGWDNHNVTVGLTGGGNGAGSHNRVYNNDGGVVVYHMLDPGSTEVVNNIGYVGVISSGPGIAVSHNLPASVDPRYMDAGTQDYRPRDDSPARSAGLAIAGVTEGSTDATPSIGAYQFGAPFWRAGAGR